MFALHVQVKKFKKTKSWDPQSQINIRNEKFVDKAQQCFAFLQIKPKFKFVVQ